MCTGLAIASKWRQNYTLERPHVLYFIKMQADSEESWLTLDHRISQRCVLYTISS